jgi:signal transduction histidine kinase
VGLLHDTPGQASLANDLTSLPAAMAGPLQQTGFYNALLAVFARRGQVTGMLVVGNRPGGFGQDESRLLVTVAHQAAIAIENAQLFTTLREERERLRALSNRLTQAQEAERTRIARELHDEAGQALTTVRLQLDFVASVLPDDLPAPIRRQVEEAQTLIGRTLEEIRRISIDLRPSLLDDLGLASALRWHCERLGRHAQMDVVFEGPSRTRRLPSDVETAVYRAAQEALTNVARHAQANSVQVRLDYQNGQLRLTIADDGVGFAENRVSGTGIGLMGMQERLSAVGGTLRVESVPDGGSTLFIRVPIQGTPGQE